MCLEAEAVESRGPAGTPFRGQEILGRYLSVRMAHRKNYQRREALLATLETDVDLLSGKFKFCAMEKL